jgi:hypothetical protein
MTEQTVSKLNNGPEQRRKRIYRIGQILLGAALVLGYVLGFTLLSALWESDRSAFWAGTLQLLLLGTPILALIGILEVMIGRIGAEFDYELSGESFAVYRVAHNRRKLFCHFSLKDVRWYKRYSELTDEELLLLKKALFACCNSDSPALALAYVDDLVVGRVRGPRALLLEPEERLEEAFKKALRRKDV